MFKKPAWAYAVSLTTAHQIVGLIPEGMFLIYAVFRALRVAVVWLPYTVGDRSSKGASLCLCMAGALVRKDGLVFCTKIKREFCLKCRSIGGLA